MPLGVTVGDPKGQSLFEYFTVLLVLLTWGSSSQGAGLAVLGDNIAALQCSISLKGRGAMDDISREIAWRRVRRGWFYAVGHIAAEDNILADALSRTAAPPGSDKKDKPEGFLKLRRVRPRLPWSAWETLL